MATQKRRVVYLSDQEWSKAGKRAQKLGLSVSAYVRELLAGRSFRSLAEDASLEREFGHLSDLDVAPTMRPTRKLRPFLQPAIDKAMQEFRPAPKPGRK